MIVRTCLRCTGRARPRPFSQPSLPKGAPRFQCRRFSSTGAAHAASTSGTSGSNAFGVLAPFVNELDRVAPSFDLRGDQIEVIQTPTEFYETLKDRIRNAKRRIFLSTLYIGKSERELLETLRDAMKQNPELKLSILTDALRGTREAPAPTCASLLVPLVAEFGADRVEVRMYHTPNLTGLRKKSIPKRINEGWGLQHMKLYGIDDEIIMSG
jgi:CDP-diacylglycerol--glycerol-3-phosphate 3-phosphatidyltransferase